MNEFLITLNNSLPLFVTLGVVLAFRYFKVFKKSLSSSLSPLIFKLVLPLFAFNAIYSLSFSVSDWPVLVAIFLANILLLLTLFIVFRASKLQPALLGAVLLLSLSYSIGPVGYPFVQLNFSNEVFYQMVAIDMLLFITIMILGPIIGSLLDSSVRSDPKKIVKSIVTDPALIAVFTGGLLNILNVSLPTSFINSIEFVSGSFTFLVTVFVGLTLSLPDWQESKLLISSMAVRLLFALAVSWMVITFLDPSPAMKLAVPLTLFMAYGSFPLVYTERHNLNSEFVAQASLFSRIVIYLLYPFLMTYLKTSFL